MYSPSNEELRPSPRHCRGILAKQRCRASKQSEEHPRTGGHSTIQPTRNLQCHEKLRNYPILEETRILNVIWGPGTDISGKTAEIPIKFSVCSIADGTVPC